MFPGREDLKAEDAASVADVADFIDRSNRQVVLADGQRRRDVQRVVSVFPHDGRANDVSSLDVHHLDGRAVLVSAGIRGSIKGRDRDTRVDLVASAFGDRGCSGAGICWPITKPS